MVTPTPEFVRNVEKTRWEPEPECQAMVNFIRDALVRDEGDGVSMLERIFRTCDYENQRNREIEAAAFAMIGKRFKEKFAFFQADCPDDGRCRFHLRLADNHRDIQYAPPAHAEFFLNLLKTPDEWIRPPLELRPAPPVQPRRPVPRRPK